MEQWEGTRPAWQTIVMNMPEFVLTFVSTFALCIVFFALLEPDVIVSIGSKASTDEDDRAVSRSVNLFQRCNSLIRKVLPFICGMTILLFLTTTTALLLDITVGPFVVICGVFAVVWNMLWRELNHVDQCPELRPARRRDRSGHYWTRSEKSTGHSSAELNRTAHSYEFAHQPLSRSLPDWVNKPGQHRRDKTFSKAASDRKCASEPHISCFGHVDMPPKVQRPYRKLTPILSPEPSPASIDTHETFRKGGNVKGSCSQGSAQSPQPSHTSSQSSSEPLPLSDEVIRSIVKPLPRHMVHKI